MFSHGIERFLGSGLGMPIRGESKLWPSLDQERVKQLAQVAKVQLDAMLEKYRVQEALGVDRELLDSTITNIAGFHALAYDLRIYWGLRIGFFTRRPEDKGFYLLINEEDTAPLQGPRYDTSVAIRIGHPEEGPLTYDDVPGLESRWLFNLGRGLRMSANPLLDSGLKIHTSSVSADIHDSPDYLFKVLAPEYSVTPIGELTHQIPKQFS